jgi:transposase
MVMEEITEEPGALTERVAALDIGKASLTVCIRVPHEDKPGARRQEVRTYATLTPALLELRDWLVCQGVTLVVMEATSAYWKPPFYLLEDDIECQVVNARDVKNVPGRPKTDPTRCGCTSSPSGACSGPASSRPARSASCGT